MDNRTHKYSRTTALALCFAGCLLAHGSALAATLEKTTGPNKIDAITLIDNNGKRHQLTDFKEPTTVYGHVLSPDERYAWVAIGDEEVRKQLAIYQTADQKLLSLFIPTDEYAAWRGGFSWTRVNTIWHIWGCGTSCMS